MWTRPGTSVSYCYRLDYALRLSILIYAAAEDPGALACVGSTCAIFGEFLVGHHECKLQFSAWTAFTLISHSFSVSRAGHISISLLVMLSCSSWLIMIQDSQFLCALGVAAIQVKEMSSIVLGAFFVARAFSEQEKLETLDSKSVLVGARFNKLC